LSCKRHFLPCFKMNHIRDKPHEIMKAIIILYKTTKFWKLQQLLDLHILKKCKFHYVTDLQKNNLLDLAASQKYSLTTFFFRWPTSTNLCAYIHPQCFLCCFGLGAHVSFLDLQVDHPFTCGSFGRSSKSSIEKFQKKLDLIWNNTKKTRLWCWDT
jgi:hypothetical protein